MTGGGAGRKRKAHSIAKGAENGCVKSVVEKSVSKCWGECMQSLE